MEQAGQLAFDNVRVEPAQIRETGVYDLERICEEHLAGKYEIEVIDLRVNPQLAKGDEIIAVPTLVRHLPEPITKIIGDLSNTEQVLVGLQLLSKVA